MVKADNYVLIDGTLQLQEDGIKFFAEKISELKKEKDDIFVKEEKMILEFKNKVTDNVIFTELKEIFARYKGEMQVILRFPDLKKEMILSKENWVNGDKQLFQELAEYQTILSFKKE